MSYEEPEWFQYDKKPQERISRLEKRIDKLEENAHYHTELFELHIVKKVLDKIAQYSKQLGFDNKKEEDSD